MARSNSFQLKIHTVLAMVCILVKFNEIEAFGRGRIVNGTQAIEGEFPFMLSLRRSKSGRHYCGASIVNRDWALTAAHCVSSAFAARINLQYGCVELDANSTNIVNVSKIFVHEGYLPQNQFINDIALLKLKSPLNFGAKVRPIRLPKMQQITQANEDAVLIGWGYNATGGSVQKYLQKVRLQTYTDDECSNLHQTDMHATALCAGEPAGGRGQCSGDSGGPLMVNGQQVGIVSWSRKPCAVAPYPGIFTEVSAYVEWIFQTISTYNDLVENNNIEDSLENFTEDDLTVESKKTTLQRQKK